jgi:peptidoglycan/LPS O-acetylase OafA/YrhL
VVQIKALGSTSGLHAMNDTRAYRPDIDGLRAIAVLSVLFFHVDMLGFSGGFVGVDIFFVISGYLITKNIVSDIRQQRWSFRAFYVRRWRRLFPASFFVLILCFVFAFLLLPPPQMSRFGQSLLYAITYLSNFFFWSESGYFDISARFKPLLHMWSLAVEEQFYLVWPLTLVVLMRAPQRFFLPVALVILCGISVILSEVFLDTEPSAVFYLLPFRIFEFAIGAILVWLKPIKKEQVLWYELLLFTGFLLMFYSITQYSEVTVFPGVNALVPCFGAALAIYAGTAKYLGFFLRNRIAVGTGLISYSVYLVHWPLIVFYRHWPLRELTSGTQLSIIVLSLGFGYGIYRFIEQPFRRSTKPSSPSNGWGYIGVCLVLMAVVAVPASNAWISDGWTWRITYSENRQAVLEELSYPSDVCQVKEFLSGCFIGEEKKGPTDVLLIGDSHAEHLWVGLDYLGKKYNLEVYLWKLLGCPPIFDTRTQYPQDLKGFESACTKLNERWETYIASVKPKVVVLAARWALYFEPQSVSPRVSQRYLLLDKENPIISSEQARRVFASHLQETVNTITQLGSKVVIVSQVPSYKIDPSYCNSMPDYLFFNRDGLQDRCKQATYEEMRDHLRFADETIERIAKNSDDVLAVIMSDIFCNDESRRCKFDEEDVPLYKDGNHLNKYGSFFAGKRMERQFKQFIYDI